MPDPTRVRRRKNPLEQLFEFALFNARWLLAPFYIGLVACLVLLAFVFFKELVDEIPHALENHAVAILLALNLIDLSLTGNLILIVTFSGYENFVSKIDTGGSEDRPSWMGKVDFSGLKIRVIASIVAISAISLLKSFMSLSEGEGAQATIDHPRLAWLVGLHLTFVVSGVLLALMDKWGSQAERAEVESVRGAP